MPTAIDLRRLPGAREVSVVTDRGYFPVLVRLPDDAILAVFRAGAGHEGLGGRLEASRSEDGGLSWSEPVVIADSERDDRNPAVGVAPDGSVVCAYHLQGSYDAEGRFVRDASSLPYDTRVVRSEDGGRIWGKPTPLGDERLNGCSPFGHILTLPDGTMVMPIYGGAAGDRSHIHASDGPNVFHSSLLRSTDGGRTWGDPTLVGRNLSEGAFLRHPRGQWVAAIRTEKPHERLAWTESLDKGRTWSDAQRLTEPGEMPADLIALGGGHVLLVYGCRHEPFGVAGMLSSDGGRTWLRDRPLILNDDRPGDDCGYPSGVRLDDGTLVIAYYSAGDHMELDRGDGAFCRTLRPPGKRAPGSVWSVTRITDFREIASHTFLFLESRSRRCAA